MQYKRIDYIAIWTLLGIFFITAWIPSLDNEVLNLGILIICLSSIITLGMLALLWFDDYSRNTCMIVVYLELTIINLTTLALFSILNWNLLVIPSLIITLILVWYTLHLPHKQ